MSTVYYWQESDQSASTVLTLTCPHCEFPLTLHQPDPDLPDRLLATCDDCKSWFLANSQGVASHALPACTKDRRTPGLTG